MGMRSHTSPAPLGHGRAAARRGCRPARSEHEHDELALVTLELALTCLKGIALAHAMMALQEIADESEARAADALAAADDPNAGPDAMRRALDAAASFARANREEFATTTRWMTYVTEARELAHRALRAVSDSSF